MGCMDSNVTVRTWRWYFDDIIINGCCTYSHNNVVMNLLCGHRFHQVRTSPECITSSSFFRFIKPHWVGIKSSVRANLRYRIRGYMTAVDLRGAPKPHCQKCYQFHAVFWKFVSPPRRSAHPPNGILDLPLHDLVLILDPLDHISCSLNIIEYFYWWSNADLYWAVTFDVSPGVHDLR